MQKQADIKTIPRLWNVVVKVSWRDYSFMVTLVGCSAHVVCLQSNRRTSQQYALHVANLIAVVMVSYVVATLCLIMYI